ncbi:MAG TPA: hypothetical protein VH951_14625 [Dehalococcoidia bacterium]
MQHEHMPAGVSVAMAAGILTMIVTVMVILALFTWQPWRDDTRVNGIQGGGNPTPVREYQRSVPLTR